MRELRAHGKFLLTGEYFVLNGARALAIPLSKGQCLSVRPISDKNIIVWRSFDHEGHSWFEASYSLPDLNSITSSDTGIAGRLQLLLRNAFNLRPEFVSSKTGWELKSMLEFPRDWGLGSSSTLVWLVANWMGVDPFELQFKTFGGSGYDIACAGATSPLIYQLQNGKPSWQFIPFQPSFSSQLHFIYLGQKQDSLKEIAKFLQKGTPSLELVDQVSDLTGQWIKASNIDELVEVIHEHEEIVGEFLGRKSVQSALFPDFPGGIKALGAWGGDFVLAACQDKRFNVQDYFLHKGYDVCLAWSELSLH